MSQNKSHVEHTRANVEGVIYILKASKEAGRFLGPLRTELEKNLEPLTSCLVDFRR